MERVAYVTNKGKSVIWRFLSNEGTGSGDCLVEGRGPLFQHAQFTGSKNTAGGKMRGFPSTATSGACKRKKKR